MRAEMYFHTDRHILTEHPLEQDVNLLSQSSICNGKVLKTIEPTGDFDGHRHPLLIKAVSWLVDTINHNLQSDPAKRIHGLMTSGTLLKVAEGVVHWFNLVKPGGPWDHKSKLLRLGMKYVYDPQTQRMYEHDIWSNIHYGYIGLSVGFNEWQLEQGGGLGQLMSNRVPDGYWKRRLRVLGDADILSAFDDPPDQTAIKIGFDLWRISKTGIDSASLEALIRRHATRLNGHTISKTTENAE